MKTISRWVGPCRISRDNQSTSPILFDFTQHVKTILKNEVWNRKYSYGLKAGLKNTDIHSILSCNITIHPRFFSGLVNNDRHVETLKEICGPIPKHFRINNYKNWDHQDGLIIIETVYKMKDPGIPTVDDLTAYPIPNWNMDFVVVKEQFLAVIAELAAFFLATMKLTFVTEEPSITSRQIAAGGLLQVKNGRKGFFAPLPLNGFLHPLHIEMSKLNIINQNTEAFASIWHFNLWPIRRYLIGVDAFPVSMDNLLDLIYSLEGLFQKNSSSDFIKMMCIVHLCKTRNEAAKMREFLDLAYRIRNDVAHGEKSYDLFDKVTLGNKEILAQDVYWKMKKIVAGMIIFASRKLLADSQRTNLRFNMDDLFSKIFP